MRKMRNIFVLLLSAIMCVSVMAGCSGGAQSEQVAINSPADLEGLKIAVQEGTTGDLIASAINGAEISRFKKGPDCMLELLNGRVDCVIIDEQPAIKLVEANEDKTKILDFAPTKDIEAYALAVAKEDEALLADINAAIDTIKANGTYDLIFAKYLSGEDVSLPEIQVYQAIGTLIVGTNAEFEPFEYRNDANEITGFDMEMMKYIGAELKLNIQIEDMNFDSLIAALQSGKIDVIAAGMTNTEERSQNVNFSQDYYESTQAIIVRQ